MTFLLTAARRIPSWLRLTSILEGEFKANIFKVWGPLTNSLRHLSQCGIELGLLVSFLNIIVKDWKTQGYRGESWWINSCLICKWVWPVEWSIVLRKGLAEHLIGFINGFFWITEETIQLYLFYSLVILGKNSLQQILKSYDVSLDLRVKFWDSQGY